MEKDKYVAYVSTYTQGDKNGIKIYDVDMEKGRSRRAQARSRAFPSRRPGLRSHHCGARSRAFPSAMPHGYPGLRLSGHVLSRTVCLEAGDGGAPPAGDIRPPGPRPAACFPVPWRTPAPIPSPWGAWAAPGQDNAVTWLDWRGMERNADLHGFWKMLAGFRRRNPILPSCSCSRSRPCSPPRSLHCAYSHRIPDPPG